MTCDGAPVTALLTTASYTVDPWDPGYGVAAELDGRSESTARLDLDVELPAASWRPVSPSSDTVLPPSVLFLDGVRRIDARVWVHGGGPQPVPAIAASLAVGLVHCTVSRGTPAPESPRGTPAPEPSRDGSAPAASGGAPAPGGGEARIVDVRVDRGLYTSAPAAADFVTRHGVYAVRHVRAAPPTADRAAPSAPAAASAGNGAESGPPGGDDLSLAVQRRLSELEVELATAWRARPGGSPDDLLVVDGPLRGHATHVAGAVGYVKTHQLPYLRAPQAQVVADLAAGQRTPVFAMTTSWRRHSWYLRLPGSSGAPWSGVVRLECSADLPAADAVALADLTARLLPAMASTPHKDPRAPQNLVPIGGLERQLRHRLGDAALLYRSLRAAAS